MKIRALLPLLLVALLAPRAFSEPAVPAVVILPFENLSAVDSAAKEMETRIAEALQKKGWTVVAQDGVQQSLEKHRIRYVDSLDDDNRTALLEENGAIAYVSGSLYTYDGGRNPTVGLCARMVRSDGTIAWADVVGLASSDTEKAFGFGRAADVQAVADAAIAKLADRMPKAGAEAKLPRGPRKPLFRGGPATFRAPDLDPRRPHLVCVLPLENASETSEASRIVAEILTVRLAAANGFEVVDPAKLRAAALKARIPTFRTASNDVLERLVPLVGTSLFLRGTVYDFGAEGTSTEDPFVEMELTLDDVTAQRTVWAAQHRRYGSDYTGLMMLGAASNDVTLADRIISEMIDSESDRAARGGQAWAAARSGHKRTPSRRSELRDPKHGDNR